ncbi:MAG: glycosyltransferase family 4 protein [Halothece sp.]
MRIAQIAPLWEKVPPPAYGGTELVVSLLTDELVKRGHEVTLFATANSQTLGKLEPGAEQPLRKLGVSEAQYNVYEQMQLSKVFSQAQNFDLIHAHVGYAAFPYTNFSKTPVVHTLHGTIPSWLEPIFKQHRQQNFVSISNSQQRPELGLNYVGTVYNAIAHQNFQFHPQPHHPPYLAFLGRLSPEKGPHLAIEIAKRTQLPLKIAGKVDPVDEEFFKQEVAPHIDGKQIQFLGEANHQQKNDLMGGAIATLFPITWREPFGLVMIESLACGTPVIAMNLGSAAEIIISGQNGFLCHNVEDCVNAVSQLDQISRQTCRFYVEQTFNVKRMTDGYEAIYQKVVGEKVTQNGHFNAPALVLN